MPMRPIKIGEDKKIRYALIFLEESNEWNIVPGPEAWDKGPLLPAVSGFRASRLDGIFHWLKRRENENRKGPRIVKKRLR